MCRCLIALTTLLLVAVGSSTEKAASFVVNSGAAEALIARQAAEGYLQKATKALRQLIDRMSAVEPDLTRQLWLADLQDQAGDLPGALDTASRLLGETEASSRLESAVLEEIASWFVRDDYQGLRLYYQELAARYPTRAILRQRLGEQARNADEASSYFESALSLTRDGNESVWAAYFESLRRHQADKEALKVIARWHKAHAPNADLAWMGVEIAMTLKDPALQEEAGDLYLQASAHSAHALRRLAAYQEFHGHVRPAERTLRSSVLIHPTDSELKFALLSFRKRHGQAVDFPFETSRNARLGMSERKANALADPSARGARRLLQLALRENDLPTALKHLEQWKARDPSDPRAWLQQAHLLALSEKGAAISLLEEAHRRSPSDSAIAESLLILYLERRRNQEGLALITTMTENASSDLERTRWQERRARMLDVLEVPIREQTDWLPRNVATARQLQEEVSLTAQDWLHLGRRAFFHNRKSWATKWFRKALQLDDCLENCRAHIHLLGHTDFILAALQDRLRTESHPATALELLHLLASRRDWAAVHKLARTYCVQFPEDYRFPYFEGVALAELGWSEASQEVFLGLLAHDDGLLSSRSLFPPLGFFRQAEPEELWQSENSVIWKELTAFQRTKSWASNAREPQGLIVVPKDLRQLRHLSLHYLITLAGADRQELIAEAEHLGIAQASWYFLPDQDPTLVDLMTREDPAKQREDLMKASRYDEAKERQPFIALTLLSGGQRILCESDHSPLPISADRRAREALALARLMTLPEHHVYIASHLAGILDLGRDLSPVLREKLVREIMRRLRKAPPHTFPVHRTEFAYGSGRFRAPTPRLIEGLVRAEAFPELLEALDLVMRMRRDFPQTSFEEVNGQFMLGMFRHHQPDAYFQWLRSPLTSMVGPEDLAGILKDIDWSKANIDELIPSLQTPLLRAQLWAHLGDHAALTEELDQWRHADLTDSPLLVAAGRHALSEGQLEQANADFHRAVSWTKVTPSSRHALGGLLECALEAGPSQPILWKDGKRAAWRLRKQQGFRRNSELLVAMNILGLDPDFPRPRPFLGELERPSVDWRWEHQVDQLVAAGDRETALRLILRAVHGYQIAYLAGGDARPEALLKAVSRAKLDRAVMAAVSKDPTRKAVYLDWLGEKEKAEVAYRESLKLNPDNHAIRGRLASLLAASDSDQAIALLLEIPANELDSYYLEKAFRGLNWYERIQGQLRAAETGIRYLEKRIEQGDISAASRWIKALKARLERAFREPDDPSWTLPEESEAKGLERKGDPLALERRRLLYQLNQLIESEGIDLK